MPQKMRMHSFFDPRYVGVVGNDLLNPSLREFLLLPTFEQEFVSRYGLHVRFQRQPKPVRKKDIAVFTALAVVDEDFVLVEIHVGHADGTEFGDADGGVEEKAEHDGMEEIVGFVDGGEIAFEGRG